jgi:hypothetical protein
MPKRPKRLHVEDIEWLVECGGTWDSIPARVGAKNKRSLLDCLQRHQRQDLIAVLNKRGSDG